MTYTLHIIITIAMSIPVTLGYNLVFGRGKILHFGPLAVSVVAAYGVFLTQRGTGSFALGILVGFAATVLVSSLFAWLALRLDSDALGILTIACHLAAVSVVLNWVSFTRGALGLAQIPRMPGLQTMPAFALATVAVAALWTFLMWKIDRSPLGRSLGALAESRVHAESLGISRASVYLQTFLVAGIGSLLSNIFFPQYISLLHPNDYGFPSLIFIVMCVVAGKPGSVPGVTLAVALLTMLKEGLRFLPMSAGLVGPLRLILFGVILVVAVYVRRKDLFPQPRTI
jgi:ABC-type branched-subunit amino acid transport system permease subunit